MLAYNEAIISHLVKVSQLFDQGKCTMGQISRAKANTTLLGREVCRLAREVCGGNGIILDNDVMRFLLDMEGIYTFEGTYEINSLVSGRELTGGLQAFV
jgi:alkylation response protein AidB-like acyl-CoA dehydrogenase